MIDLASKTALVTGGGRGIGRAIALTLAKAGAITYITYKDDLSAATQTANLSAGRIKAPLHVDVSDSGSVAKMALVLRQELTSGLDILVNNAGINIPGPLDKISEQDWEAVLSVNLRGPWLVTKALLQDLNHGASVVNIGSVSGFIGGPISGHYAAGKSGLVALTQSFALLLARRDIRCNVVAPGYIKSEMVTKAPQIDQLVNRIPLGRVGNYNDVAGAVLFLASGLSSYITGSVLHVNGGLYFG